MNNSVAKAEVHMNMAVEEAVVVDQVVGLAEQLELQNLMQ
jgi:hypothetical protein